MTTLGLISLIFSIGGSAILVTGFIPQAKRIYTLKHTYGISKFSWVQNFIGRIVFPLYIAMTLASKDSPTAANSILAAGQLAVGVMSIPVIYYIFRNQKTNGEYVKEHYRKELAIIRSLMALLLLGSAIVIFLMMDGINVINIESREAQGYKIFLFIFGFISSAVVSTAFVPQSFKTIKTKNTKSTSLLLTIMFTIGNTLIMFAFVIKIINAITNHKDTLTICSYIGPLIFINMGSIAMITIITIKVRNMKLHGEKM